MDFIEELEKIELEDKKIKANLLKREKRQKIDEDFLEYMQSNFSELTSGINLENYNFLKKQMKVKFNREKSSILVWIRGTNEENQPGAIGIISWAKNSNISPTHLSDILGKKIIKNSPNLKELEKLNDGLKIYNVPAIFYLHKLITGTSNTIETHNKFLKNHENITIINNKSEEIFKNSPFDIKSFRYAYVENFWLLNFEAEKIKDLTIADDIINFVSTFFSYYFKNPVHFEDNSTSKVLKNLNYTQIHRDYGLEIARNLYQFYYQEKADILTLDDEYFFKTLETNDASIEHFRAKNKITEHSRLVNSTVNNIKKLILGLYNNSEAEAQKIADNVFNKSYVHLKHHHISNKLTPISFAFFFTHYLIFEKNDPRPLTSRTIVNGMHEVLEKLHFNTSKNALNDKLNKADMNPLIEFSKFMSDLEVNLVIDKLLVDKFKSLFLNANPDLKKLLTDFKSDEQEYQVYQWLLSESVMQANCNPSSENIFWRNLPSNEELFLSCIEGLLKITKIQSEQSKEITKSRKAA